MILRNITSAISWGRYDHDFNPARPWEAVIRDSIAEDKWWDRNVRHLIQQIKEEKGTPEQAAIALGLDPRSSTNNWDPSQSFWDPSGPRRPRRPERGITEQNA